MRFTRNREYKVTAYSENGKYIAQTYNNFANKREIISWAIAAAIYNWHKKLGRINVYCVDTDEFVVYSRSGKIVK